MKCNLKKCDGGGFLLQTESYYDNVIVGKNFMATYHQKQKEVIIFDQDLIWVQKINT